MRLLVLSLLLLPLAAAAQGTGTLHGRIVDDTGMGLPGANVILNGTTLGAATDRDGRYHILGVPAGTYTVTHAFIGFSSVTASGVYVGSGETVVLNGVLYDWVCCLAGCSPLAWEPPLALLNPDPYASRRLRPDDLVLFAYR